MTGLRAPSRRDASAANVVLEQHCAYATAMGTLNTEDSRRRISLADFKRDLARRLEEAGPIDMPRNSGTRRTRSKQILLGSLAKLGAIW
jgi:hypothetical protein